MTMKAKYFYLLSILIFLGISIEFLCKQIDTGIIKNCCALEVDEIKHDGIDYKFFKKNESSNELRPFELSKSFHFYNPDENYISLVNPSTGRFANGRVCDKLINIRPTGHEITINQETKRLYVISVVQHKDLVVSYRVIFDNNILPPFNF